MSFEQEKILKSNERKRSLWNSLKKIYQVQKLLLPQFFLRIESNQVGLSDKFQERVTDQDTIFLKICYTKDDKILYLQIALAAKQCDISYFFFYL